MKLKNKLKKHTDKYFDNIQNESLKIVLFYFAFGVTWIVLSDWMLGILVNDEMFYKIQTYKGLIYIAITSLVIFLLVNNRIAELKKKSAALMINQKTLSGQVKLNDSIVNHSPVIIVRMTADGVILNMNDFGCQLLGYKREEMINRNWIDLLVTKNKEENVKRLFETILEKGNIKNVEEQIIKKNTQVLNTRWFGVVDKYGKEDSILAVGVDITEEKKLQKDLEKMVFIDQLTGLPNRVFLEKSLMELINSNQQFSIALINVDNFKHVNNSVSYSIGDELLIAIAKALEDLVEKDDFIVRFSGDEFVYVYMKDVNRERLEEKVKALNNRFDRIWPIENYEVYTTVSIGVSRYPLDGDRYSTILRNANITMEQVKKAGKNSYLFYEEEFKWRNLDNILLVKKMQRAIDNEKFELYYQPLIDIETGKITALEGLLRWPDEEKGFISPGRFIPLSEETGQIYAIEKYVFRKALEQRKKLNERGMSDISISVNLSNKTLMNKIMFNELIDLIASFQEEFSKIIIEVTETALISDVETAIDRLAILKALGFKIALDDFGTGYSSLTYLRDLPIDIVKLDQSFIKKILYSKKDQLIRACLTTSLLLF
jgi:diguanylate cyclase (GGDEF)-like protein/PAS domain S-box-containing protein